MASSLQDDIHTRARQASLPWGDQGSLLDLNAISELARSHAIPGCEIEALALTLGIIPDRYLRNMQSITPADQIRLLKSKVAQVGLGGLGGGLLEQFLRLGIGRIRAADGDIFEQSNLNRQALSGISNMGQSKTSVAARKAAEINPSVTLETVDEFLTPDSLAGFLDGCNLAVDALGGLTMRRRLQQAAAKARIPLITGALAGWTGYVGVVLPGQTGPADIMGTDNAAEEELGCPAPAVSFIASLMASEVFNVLSNTSALTGKMLIVDIHSLTFESITL